MLEPQRQCDPSVYWFTHGDGLVTDRFELYIYLLDQRTSEVSVSLTLYFICFSFQNIENVAKDLESFSKYGNFSDFKFIPCLFPLRRILLHHSSPSNC